MKRVFILIVFSSILNQTSIAQLSDKRKPDNKIYHAIGAVGGFSTGYGLTYLGTYKKFRTQITFFPNIKEDNPFGKYYKDTRLLTGFAFFYMLDQNKVVSLFLYQGNYWYYHRKKDEIAGGFKFSTQTYTTDGFGAGLEFKFLKKLSLNIMSGYAWYGKSKSIKITGDAGLFYNF